MADPPPPSYDDAITGDYSSPPEPSSSPPPLSFPQSSPSPVLIQEPSSPLASDEESTSASAVQDQPDTVYRQSFFFEPQDRHRLSQAQTRVYLQDETESLKRRAKKLASYGCCICIIVISCLLVWYFFVRDKEPDSSVICKYLPQIPGAVLKYCPINKYGIYDLGLSCTYICPRGHSLFSKKHENDRELKDLKTSRFYIFCEGYSNWTSHELKDKICGPSETKCRTDPLKLECQLKPPNPDDCKKPAHRIEKSIWLPCPKNLHGEYTRGTKCSFKCESDYVLTSDSKGRLRSVEVPVETQCVGAQWVYTTIGNKTLQCVRHRQYIEETLRFNAWLGFKTAQNVNQSLSIVSPL